MKILKIVYIILYILTLAINVMSHYLLLLFDWVTYDQKYIVKCHRCFVHVVKLSLQ